MCSQIEVLKKQLILDPKNLKIYNQLADIYFKKNSFLEAKQFYLKSIDISEDFSILEKLARCHVSLKDFEEAIIIFEKLEKNNFVNDSIFNDFGVALRELKRYLSAIQKFDEAIKINPSNHLVYYNKANLYLEISEFEKAEKFYNKCLNIYKNFYPAIVNLATLYLKQENTSLAIKNLEKALEINPNDKIILENIARVLLLQKEFKKSENYFKKLIKIDPNSLSKIIPVIQGYTYVGDDNNYKKMIEYYSDKITDKSSIFLFNKIKRKKIKIGFVSPDIRNHPIGFFLKDLLPNLSKKIEITIFNTGGVEDEISNFCKKYTSWNFCNQNNEEISESIFKLNLDCLFDMSGLTKGNKLKIFKYKPSPIQISWAGWLASTGIKEMDYILGDHFATPKKDEKNFTEKILRMDNIWCMYSKSEFKNIDIKENNSEHTIFGCFQRPEKLNHNVLETWSEILKKKKESYLFFNNGIHQEYDKKKIVNFFMTKGIKSSRLRFALSRDRITYLNSFNLVDLNLDTFPYNGGTTSFESAYMGVPILTMKNDSIMFRCGESINKNLNMNNLISNDKDDYIEKALVFSKSKGQKFSKKKQSSEFQKSCLFDSKLFSENFVRLISKL